MIATGVVEGSGRCDAIVEGQTNLVVANRHCLETALAAETQDNRNVPAR
jgi:hypothetical protein